MKGNFPKTTAILVVVATLGIAALARAETTESGEHESKGYRIARFFNYYLMDYLDGDESHTLGLETLGEFELGALRLTIGFTWRWPIIPLRLKASRLIRPQSPVRQPASTIC